jgi:hypothetical protein
MDGIVRKSVYPVGLATIYLYDKDAPYRIVFRKDWAFVYKGRKRVWDCNQLFAETHFKDM